MSLTVIQKDITKLKVDAIVNAANAALAPGGGVCGAIFAAAGYQDLDKACRKLGGFALPAKYIVHTVGPIWRGGSAGEEELLRSCYRTSLALAWQTGCRSMAFPLISAGIYGYPIKEALAIAIQEMEAFLTDHPMDLTLAVLDPAIVTLADQLRKG